MTAPYIKEELALLQRQAHHAFRRELNPSRWDGISAQVQDTALSLEARAALRLRLLLQEEEIIRLPGEIIPAWRTIHSFPDIYAPGEREALTAGHYVHEAGRVCNIASDWQCVLNEGLLCRVGRNAAQNACIDAVIAYTDRYGDEALSQAVRHGAQGYLQALRLFRILHFCLWASNVYHCTVGRFDQYMMPFYKQDMAAGRMTGAQALDYTRAFFLSFNRDSDLYQGMQQGDNGQSLMLGGCDREGCCAVNDLTYLCLRASLENRLIDPKVNIRVTRDTPLSLFTLCSEMTRQGLGFPQYANDDVVIPALTDLGYDLQDARDYTVAACWEFIISGAAMDIPNIGAVSLAGVVRGAVVEALASCPTYAAFFDHIRSRLFHEADMLEKAVRPLYMEPAPLQSVLMHGCNGQDVSKGLRYNNYGVHGTGLATATDQLAAVKRLVYEEGSIDPHTLVLAMEQDFSDTPQLMRRLREEAPKLGRDEEAGEIADSLIDAFADSWQGRKNERGGIFRPGTGSAMYYLWHGRDLPATADGRRSGEPLSVNLSPSLLLADAGPLSVIRAMARKSVARAMNGGPLTLELHDTVLRNEEGVQKVAQLVRTFILLGGHQLQLNAVNGQALRDAQENPQAYPNLIVRVWGWSGHFIQLDRAYQDQIIQRVSYKV